MKKLINTQRQDRILIHGITIGLIYYIEHVYYRPIGLAYIAGFAGDKAVITASSHVQRRSSPEFLIECNTKVVY